MRHALGTHVTKVQGHHRAVRYLAKDVSPIRKGVPHKDIMIIDINLRSAKVWPDKGEDLVQCECYTLP